MKKIGLIFALFFLLVGCSAATTTLNSPRDISPSDALALLESDNSVILVDVRTQSEYDSGHIEGAILLPLDEISANADQVISDVDATYIIYCRSGNRSAQAVALLDQMGYTDLYDLGGILDWPYDIVS